MNQLTVPKSKNRRRSVRRRPRRSVAIQCRKGAHGFGKNLVTTILDVSDSGACMIVTEILNASAEVEIIIDGHGIGKQIRRIANVRWQVMIAPAHFFTGIEFQKPIAYREWNFLVSPDA